MGADPGKLAFRVRELSRLDIAGGGQVVVDGNHAFVGHMRPPHGTTILDISDKRNPRIVAELMLDGASSHSHKVRVNGDRMIVNMEQHDRHFRRRAADVPRAEAVLKARIGRAPSEVETAAELGVTPDQLGSLRSCLAAPYEEGGFCVYDISDRRRPRRIAHQKTGGVGVHRFHADERHAYISTEMAGYVGNILVVFDLKEPSRPEEVSRWWLPGQHVAGGETPNWRGQSHRLHHAMRCGDELWAAVWDAGFRVVDASDLTRLRTIGSYDYHPAVPEPTHTAMPFEQPIGGRRYAAVVDEEHSHIHGRLHAFLWIFDVTDIAAMKPVSIFSLGENASPFSAAPGRFGAHQFAERLDSTLVYTAWFSGGLRIVDVKDPAHPEEVGFFIPEPLGGQPSPQTNDVTVDKDGIVYIIDRERGFHILEFSGA